GRKSRHDGSHRDSGERSARKNGVYGGGNSGIDIAVALPSIVLLFGGCIVEGAVLHNRTTKSEARAKTAERGFLRLRLKRFGRIEGAVLREDESIAMDRIGPGTSDDIDRPAGSTSRFGREAVVDDLKFLDDFRGKLGAAGAAVLVIV